jgi:3-oxoacyl-[acyl-carrier protein] reductase
MINPNLQNKTALVTGANHGIGAAITMAMVAQGVKVFITYYREPSCYSEAELQQARASGIGGDMLYRAMQQQPAGPLLDAIHAQGGLALAH